MIKAKYQKILVALDGSKNSVRGLNEVIYLARQCHAIITGIYVIPRAPHPAFRSPRYPEKPRVELLVSARHGTNLSDLTYVISSKIGFQTMVQVHHILVAGRATTDDVYELLLNPVIEFIEGTVSIASY